MRGGKRLPSRVLEARGSFAKHPERRRKDAEPAPGIGEPLKYLNTAERAVWREIAAGCPDGWLCVTDRSAFARYCRLESFNRIRTLTGEETRQLDRLERGFGFQPVERGRITIAAGATSRDQLREALGWSEFSEPHHVADGIREPRIGRTRKPEIPS